METIEEKTFDTIEPGDKMYRIKTIKKTDFDNLTHPYDVFEIIECEITKVNMVGSCPCTFGMDMPLQYDIHFKMENAEYSLYIDLATIGCTCDITSGRSDHFCRFSMYNDFYLDRNDAVEYVRQQYNYELEDMDENSKEYKKVKAALDEFNGENKPKWFGMDVITW